jgi:hypothetical protein
MPDGPMPTWSGQSSATKFKRGQAGIECSLSSIGRKRQENSEKGVVCRNGSCLKAMWADSSQEGTGLSKAMQGSDCPVMTASIAITTRLRNSVDSTSSTISGPANRDGGEWAANAGRRIGWKLNIFAAAEMTALPRQFKTCRWKDKGPCRHLYRTNRQLPRLGPIYGDPPGLILYRSAAAVALQGY